MQERVDIEENDEWHIHDGQETERLLMLMDYPTDLRGQPLSGWNGDLIRRSRHSCGPASECRRLSAEERKAVEANLRSKGMIN